MARPYSNDLRERVVGSVERVPEAGARKAVSYYSVPVSALLLTRRGRRSISCCITCKPIIAIAMPAEAHSTVARPPKWSASQPHVC